MQARSFIGAVTLACAALFASGHAAAQVFPTEPVRFVVPVSQGGSISIMAEKFREQLERHWGKRVLVEYKPGAGLTIGTDYVAKSVPDGHTIGFVVTAHLINPSVRKTLPYDTVKDFAGVTMYGMTHILISATPSLPANTLPEIIAFAKQNPGKLNFASPGSGTSPHVAGEFLKLAAGIDLVHVPYKGIGPAFPDVFSGRVQLVFDTIFPSIVHARGGRIKPIAIASASRAVSAPDIPTVAETIPGFEVTSIFGVVVPSATPRWIVNQLNADFVGVLSLPEVRAKFAEFGMEPVGNKPEEFDAFIRSEIAKWTKVVRDAGIKAD